MGVALEAGAEDVVTDEDGTIEVLTDPAAFEGVRDAMVAAGLEPEGAEVTMRASTSAPVEGEAAESMLRLLEMLDDLDDVQDVYTNAELPEELVAEA